ncbi:MAG: metallopeptidase TldD-related protein [Mycobacteriales bacterium]
MNGAEIVEKALSLSQADGCVVLVQQTSGANLRWANNTLTTNGSTRDRSVLVISVVGESVGTRSASVLGDLEGLVRASEAAAREAAPAEDYGPLVTGAAAADFSAPAGSVTASVFAAAAKDLGDSFSAARADGRRCFGYAIHTVTTTWLGSSTGLRLRHEQPLGYVELTGKSAAPHGSSWVGQHTRDWSDLSIPSLDSELQRRLGWAERSVELPAGRYETLLPPSAVADLIAYLYWNTGGRDAAEGRTVFSRAGGGTRVGESFGPSALQLTSDPYDPALGTAPFVMAGGSSGMSSVFDNGLQLAKTDWIKDGALNALIQTRASASKTGAPLTPYIDNLTLEAGGTKSMDELVATTDRGLLLTTMWYIREVDPETLLLTGLTRDGVYLVEGGEVVGAVNNFRWNESPIDLLGRIAEAGRTQATLPREWSDNFTWARMPALRIGDFNMSTVSQGS